MLRTHCQTSGVSLTEQDPYNNIVRTTVEALAAVLGGTQSLHTNSFDEAIALPSEFAARVARNTQLILAEETGVTKVVDPLGGSYYVEALTNSLADEAWKLIEEVESLGGMTKAVESGMPKLRIEEAAARRQAGDRPRRRGDRRRQQVPARRRRSRRHPRRRQRERARAATRPTRRAARQPRRSRVPGGARRAARGRTRRRATCSNCRSWRRGHGRPSARSPTPWKTCSPDTAPTIRSISGVYGAAYEGDEGYAQVRAAVDEFAAAAGRRPRILVAKLGQDGHDRGAKVIATAFADLGFDVDVGPLFQTPEEAARDAIENDVHLVGVSSQAAGHKTLIPELIAAAAQAGRRRHPRGRRRRDPRAGLRRAARRRRRRDLRSRHQHPAGGDGDRRSAAPRLTHSRHHERSGREPALSIEDGPARNGAVAERGAVRPGAKHRERMR